MAYVTYLPPFPTCFDPLPINGYGVGEFYSTYCTQLCFISHCLFLLYKAFKMLIFKSVSFFYIISL